MKIQRALRTTKSTAATDIAAHALSSCVAYWASYTRWIRSEGRKRSEKEHHENNAQYLYPFKRIRNGYELFPRIGFYKHHKNVVDFTTASNICKNEGAHLVIINSYEEENVLKNIMDKNGNDAIWTGIHDPLKNREFKTIFGTPLNETGYTKWQKGEPNNNDGNESCIDFQYNYGGLNDLNCEHKRPFI
ncbi:hypothetical protein J437_LFUL013250, partial [Ladona fulva]